MYAPFNQCIHAIIGFSMLYFYHSRSPKSELKLLRKDNFITYIYFTFIILKYRRTTLFERMLNSKTNQQDLSNGIRVINVGHFYLFCRRFYVCQICMKIMIPFCTCILSYSLLHIFFKYSGFSEKVIEMSQRWWTLLGSFEITIFHTFSIVSHHFISKKFHSQTNTPSFVKNSYSRENLPNFSRQSTYLWGNFPRFHCTAKFWTIFKKNRSVKFLESSFARKIFVTSN